MISLNKNAMKIVNELMEEPELYGCKARKMKCGVNLIDMGMECPGSWQAAMQLSIKDNFVISNENSAAYKDKAFLNRKAIDDKAKTLVEEFDVRPRNINYISGSLSGGNQQKVILAREVDRNPSIMTWEWNDTVKSALSADVVSKVESIWSDVKAGNVKIPDEFEYGATLNK